ncbi:MAG: zinc ribbon domain-containing protein [Bacteroidota bacterium]
MEKKNKLCQSCMMPLSKDPQQGGTNKDGSVSTTYCSYCYQNGEFTREMTAKEMRSFVIGKLVEMKYSKFMAKLMTMGMSRMERWRK